MPSFLLDSVIVIDYLNQIPQAHSFLDEYADHSVLSVVIAAEVLVGVDEQAESVVFQFLDRFSLLNVERNSALRAARLRRRHGWHLPDAFQAALAHEHDCQLATRNTKDFDPNAHAFVYVPYRWSAS